MIYFDSKALPHQQGPSLAPLADRLIRTGNEFIYVNGSILCPMLDVEKAQQLLDSVYKINQYITIRK